MKNDSLRIDRLSLRNFRCFAECTIDLHPNLTLLVAENGCGKTAILDAIGIALGPFVETISGTHNYGGLHPNDIRLVHGEKGVMNPVLPTEVRAEGFVTEQPIEWNRALKSYGPHSRTTSREFEDLYIAAEKLRSRIERFEAEREDNKPILPIVAFYGTERLWSEDRLPVRRKIHYTKSNRRIDGYSGCLSSSSSVNDIIEWYETKMKEIGDPRYKVEQPQKLIAAVEEAMKVVLKPTGWYKLDWDSEQKRLIIEHPDQGRLPLSALSDGIRIMIALVMDIARRCVTLNPHLGEDAPRKTPGVLLIDEVDMHLHPRWQQQVVGLLCEAFPSVQMILSTHSPHVLSAVDKESIRMIRFFNGCGFLETPEFQTRGVESADVLAAIMGVDPIPQIEEARWLNKYLALIQQHLFDTNEAVKLRALLVEHFGIQHPVMLNCERMIRLEKFKKNLPPTLKQEKE